MGSGKDRIESKKYDVAMDELLQWGFEPFFVNKNLIEFQYKGSTVKYYPYKEWATGATIKDGRGLDSLIKQII